MVFCIFPSFSGCKRFEIFPNHEALTTAAHGADLRRFLSAMQITAAAAHPDGFPILREQLSRLQRVSHSREAIRMRRLNSRDPLKGIPDRREALLPGGAGKIGINNAAFFHFIMRRHAQLLRRRFARVHREARVHQDVQSVQGREQTIEHLRVGLFLRCRKVEDLPCDVQPLLTCLFRSKGIAIARLRFSRKGPH